MHKVLITPADYDRMHPAVDRVLECFPQHLRGKKVLIKPNVLRASEAREGIVTHPAMLRAVVEKVSRLDPLEIVVGDNPGLFSYGANEESFWKTGLMEAAQGCYRNIGNDAVRVAFHSDFMATVSLSRAVAEADVIISLPKFKTHGLTVLTGGIKNSYGYLPGAQKALLHRIADRPERFHALVVEVFKLRVPDLFIMDAVVGMEGNGPASPDLRDIGLILAADNAVALDSVVAFMMGLDPAQLRFLQIAKADGLGDFDLRNIKILGELKPLQDFKLPPLGGSAIQSNTVIQAMIEDRTLLRPRTDTALCTGCGTCVDQCPVSALVINEAHPEVDAGTCITCFCCQEICPEKAIALV
ncbi:MAG: DUF362 domain-containing protein [Desulfobacterales bacterium]|jgi:uncharacterized protein (DUF362 family)/Pyruvate/2-oxoacid:ferredoxin oxidoreductase delta subunit